MSGSGYSPNLISYPHPFFICSSATNRLAFLRVNQCCSHEASTMLFPLPLPRDLHNLLLHFTEGMLYLRETLNSWNTIWNVILCYALFLYPALLFFFNSTYNWYHTCICWFTFSWKKGKFLDSIYWLCSFPYSKVPVDCKVRHLVTLTNEIIEAQIKGTA